ncbi:hypothetical protein EZ313_05510 [Ramlibacter henchirensis]|uniref:Uncharacterized protein n=1 Tax=Ramlibacter henchirensis TaxID=204072 RepID=A0A4Z0C3J7_9BURK|nr:hypothetical protein [Ramlibacter henchirensis]TFZ06103.1 hypothetical protein EZ313_05510 [Ramlibacter henchirensis]
MNTNVPNADLIRAVLDGQVVQVTPNEDGWTDMDPSVAVATLVRAAPGLKFRLKPRTIVEWLPVFKGKDGAGLGNVYVDRSRIPRELPAGPVVKVIRLELDAESLEPLSATAEPYEAAPPVRPAPRERNGAPERVWPGARVEA